jgi:hypothetical protein
MRDIRNQRCWGVTRLRRAKHASLLSRKQDTERTMHAVNRTLQVCIHEKKKKKKKKRLNRHDMNALVEHCQSTLR